MGDETAVDPETLVGKDVIIEYRMQVQRVVQLRFCTVLKGIDENGKALSIALSDDVHFRLREAG